MKINCRKTCGLCQHKNYQKKKKTNWPKTDNRKIGGYKKYTSRVKPVKVSKISVVLSFFVRFFNPYPYAKASHLRTTFK